MAALPITPQRVRGILSSFQYESEKRTPPTSPEKTGGKTPSSQHGDSATSPRSEVSPEIASQRRTFASFLKRIETFSPITWFAKPPELCPLVCSRFGWENTDYDMLHCTACKSDLCGALPTKEDGSSYKKACEELGKKLLTSHKKFCTLAVNPCPETFQKVGLHDRDELRKHFNQRVAALRQCMRNLPELVYTQLETWGFAASHAAKFCEQENMSEKDTSTQVITLAFTGWTAKENSQEILICSLCRRQIGLWNYTSASSRAVGNGTHNGSDEQDAESSDDSPPPSKMRKIEPQDHLDPITSHHSWCPWIALRVLSEDAVTLVPTADNTTSPSTRSTPVSSPYSSFSTPNQSPSQGGGSPGSGGDAERVISKKQPAWVLVVRLVAPGLLSQSRRLVQQFKQSSIREGMNCIRNVLKVWSSPEDLRSSTVTASSS